MIFVSAPYHFSHLRRRKRAKKLNLPTIHGRPHMIPYDTPHTRLKPYHHPTAYLHDPVRTTFHTHTGKLN